MGNNKSYPVSKIDPNDTKIELNCRTVRPVLLYFEENYGREELEKFICETKMNTQYLESMNT